MSDALKPIEAVEQVMTRLYEAGRVDAAFDQPIERAGTTIIPCAEVAIGLGIRAGGGLSPTEGDGETGGGGCRQRCSGLYTPDTRSHARVAEGRE